MRAVNQSIGRAIRHAKDYATILLIDKRYARKQVQSKLPSWLGEHICVFRFGAMVASVAKVGFLLLADVSNPHPMQFFAQKREAQGKISVQST